MKLQVGVCKFPFIVRKRHFAVSKLQLFESLILLASDRTVVVTDQFLSENEDFLEVSNSLANFFDNLDTAK